MSNKKSLTIIFLIIILSGLTIIVIKNTYLNQNLTINNFNLVKVKSDKTVRKSYLEFFKIANLKPQIIMLDIGAKGCIQCKKMEKVLSELEEIYKSEVHINFYNVTKPDGKKIADLFDVQMIPTQIILTKEGNEKYRHVGFLSTHELKMQIDSVLTL
jgi:thiol:disulfide interchange protein